MPNPSIPPGLLRRFAAILYDGLLLIALWVAANALLLILTGGKLAETDRPDWLLAVQRLALLAVPVCFFMWFWLHGGQTLGMRAWRLRLEDARGGPASRQQAAKRLLIVPVSLASLGLGYWWVLIDPEHRAWHDLLSGTRLVLVPKNP